MADKLYYVRVRGKVMGPFGPMQLRKLRDRGQFRSFHEISEDRHTWGNAAELTDIFARETLEVQDDSDGAQPRGKPRRPAAGPPSEGWFYADAAGQHQGPIDLSVLLALRNAGSLSNETLVWREGFEEWRPLLSAVPSPAGPGVVAKDPSVNMLDALPMFLTDPVGGLPRLCQALSPMRALVVGLLCYTLGIMFSTLTTIILVEMTGVPLLDAIRDELKLHDRARIILWFLSIVLVPLISFSAAVGLVRVISRGRGSFGTDVLIAGAVNLPASMLLPLIIVLDGNPEVVIFLGVMLITLPILMLGSAFTRWIQLPDKGAIFAVPAVLVGSVWITKIIMVSLFGRMWLKLLAKLFAIFD